jgi:hypothetical protein
MFSFCSEQAGDGKQQPQAKGGAGSRASWCRKTGSTFARDDLEARLRYTSGERQLRKLSRDCGVSRETIKNAILGMTFKDLPMQAKGEAMKVRRGA